MNIQQGTPNEEGLFYFIIHDSLFDIRYLR